MDTLLKLMETNAHLTPSQLAVMCDMKAEEIESKIKEYEEKGARPLSTGIKPTGNMSAL